MAANEILGAVSTDTGTNLLTQAEYVADAQRLTGNQPGIARAKLVNKMLRQVSLIAAAVGEYIAGRQTVDIVDSLTPANTALYLHTAMNNANVGVVSGAADAIEVAFTPAATVLQKGLIFWKAAAPNATTTPTLERDALGAKAIVKGNDLPLKVGDIATDAIMISYYDSVLDKEILINPILGVEQDALYRDMADFTATVAANALTGVLVAETLDFRSAVATSGTPVQRTAAGNGTLVVPNTATLGTTNGVSARLVWGWLDNAGTLEPWVCNLTGGLNLDETTLISTTAIGTGSDSANVIYSGSARAGVAFRVRGFCDISEAAAGVWATGPTLVQPIGGFALAALSSLGYGQSWQDVTGSRALGVTQYNTTGKPIIANVAGSAAGGNTSMLCSINGGGAVPFTSIGAITGNLSGSITIPVGASYVVTGASMTLGSWFELR